jgi:Mycothiol maleylpyruvate isomerase N-terminal domain
VIVATYPFPRARDAFVAEYALLDVLAASLTDEQTLLRSRCRGWAVCDVLCHLDLGMVEILVALASPTDRQADTDFAAYWRDCCAPGEPDLGHARWIRLVASAYARPGGLVRHLRMTTGAALRQARAAPPDQRLEFQGHVIEMGDFLATWVVEAAVHHLDLTVELPDAPPPVPASLQVTRDTLDALLGERVPVGWDDATYALKGTGRLALTGQERDALGQRAERFPLFG